MASINKVTLIGFIGDDPKINTTQSGRKVASLTLATTEKGYTTQAGVTYPDKTEWHDVVLWGKLAEVTEKYLRKGAQIYIDGKLRHRTYEKDGQKRYVTEIEAENMQMLDRNPNASQASSQAAPPADQGKKDDDLPF